MTRRITILLGSPHAKSRSTALAKEVVRQLPGNYTFDYIALADIDANALLHADFRHADIQALISRVTSADALILTSPVYKASISGGLKALIDVLPENSLKGKTILPLVSGGSVAHLLAIDHALHPIITSLKAERYIPAVFAADADVPKNAEGEYRIESAELSARLQQAAAALQQSLQAGLNAVSNTQPLTLHLVTI